MSKSTTSRSAPRPSASERETGGHRYTAEFANEIELRWQAHWDEHETFRVPNPGDPGFDPARPKFYCLDMFPYPSGTGLHVGHPEGYTATDIVCRYRTLRGFNVLRPMGWDAFGLPAEQYAIETGVHPAITTRSAIETFRRQLKRFGFSYDWSREFATSDPDYYRWTQWIWLKAYHAWCDPIDHRARPIETLIQRLENGDIYIGPGGEPVFGGISGDTEALGGKPVGCRKWHELEDAERRQVVDNQRLAYIDEQTVNWCPKLGTALANEEVKDGYSERGHHPVFRMPLRQWMFRITAFAERLLDGLEHVDWPDSTRTQQMEWIGRSEGADVDFAIADATDHGTQSLRVYTTRPDTLFGATFMVVAPEHPLIGEILNASQPETDPKALRDYVEQARSRTEVDRMAETTEKTGVFTGAYAINPVNEKRIPIWTADYVLMGYGTGAIMAVPGQDQRDWEFARKFDLPIIRTVQPPDDFDGEAYLGDGPAINSEFLNGLHIDDAKPKIIAWLEQHALGKAKVNYKLRDWLFSRQRYWGEPFPIVFDEQGNHHPVDESNLPVVLPEMDDYHPIENEEPVPLLAKATDWVNTTAGKAGVAPDVLPSDSRVKRETNTMPGWAGSCWYYLRFCDPRNADRFADRDVEHYWMLSRRDDGRVEPGESFDPGVHHRGGVDLYIGGAEHAVLHLLYARFWHMILYDLGEVSTPEPFGKLFHQGLITSFAYMRPNRSLVPIDEVEEVAEGEFIEKATGKPVTQVTAKMSKSLKNVVNPDDIIHDFGADSFRLYEMYLGPLEASKPWNTNDMVGVFRFLQRTWRLAVDETTGAITTIDEHDGQIEKLLHRTIAKVGGDIERLAFNTAIAAMIEFVNEAQKSSGLTRDQLERFTIVLSPFAPHIAEELWSRMGNEPSIADASWPAYDEAMLREDRIELPVQIMGKVRGKITVPADADQAAVERAALADARIGELLAGKTVRKVVVVPGKIVNIVAS